MVLKIEIPENIILSKNDELGNYSVIFMLDK